MTTTLLDLTRVLPGHPPQDDVCVEHLKKELSRESGVQNVGFETSAQGASLSVEHSSALSAAALEGLARRAGNEVQAHFRHETLSLSGFHCKDCATTVESVVGRLPGVRSVDASYTLERANLVYDTSQVDLPRITGEITALGYRVSPPQRVQTTLEETVVESAPKRFKLPKEMLLAFASGAAFLIGWLGAVTGGFPPPLSLLFYVLAYVAGGYDITVHAFRAARKGRFDIDALMVVAALGAAALDKWAEGALLLFLFSLGHALEHYAMNRSRNAIRALATLAPKTARVRRAEGESVIPVAALTLGDQVIVRAGERLPADGRVVSGESGVDQAPITGESLPVSKSAGDVVFAGTINGDGTLIVETTRNPEDSTLSRVIKLVEEAQSAKSPTQRFTERFERVFVPIILVATVLLIVLPPLFGVAFETSFVRAMTLLVAASPCALALATPSAVLAGVARAARSGVLIKGGAHLEAAGTARVVAFDKTGTLTQGKPQLTDVVSTRGGMTAEEEGDLLARVAAAESRSTHPLAAALVREAELRGLTLPEVGAFEALKGRGVRAIVAGRELYIGNERLMTEAALEFGGELAARKGELEANGKTVMIVAQDGRAVGLLAVRDEPRVEARAMLERLKSQGIKRTVMLTGDNRSVAEAIGRELGIDEVRAELLPEDKLAAIKELRTRYGKIIMVGDGVNDAPAMAEASVGVAMGGAGTDVALETADMALMGDDLTKFPYALALSRASRRMIVQNLFISLGVIALLVPSALLGLAGIGIAVVLHESSTLVVVLNALRLLRFTDRPFKSGKPVLLKGNLA